MKRVKDIMTMIIIVPTIFILFIGCSSKDNQDKNESKNVSIDALGREVENIPDIERLAITCYGGTTHEISILGASENIVAQPNMDKFNQLLKMYPRFKNVIDAGSFDNVNIEELLNQDPEIAFVGVTSESGNKLIEDSGIKTFTMLIGSAEVEPLKKEFQNIGKLLGKEQMSQKLVDYWDEKLSMVKSLVDKIPESERKRIYYAGGKITEASSGKWGDSFITGAGGINVLKDITKGAKGVELSVEQVIDLNPDVVITQKRPEGTKGIIDDTRIKNLDFVKNNKVYSCPIGAFWWDRPSPESPLGFMWLAKTLYPEYTESIDLREETKYFYKEFYDYELSDDEYNSFF